MLWEKQRNDARKLLMDAEQNGDPTMITYMSDGWSTWLREVQCYDVAPNHRFYKHSRNRVEYLMEKTLAKTIDYAGRIQGSIILRSPVDLSVGKTGWDIFAHSISTISELFGDQCKRISILILLQDGLHSHSFRRRHRARADLYCGDVANEDLDMDNDGAV